MDEGAGRQRRARDGFVSARRAEILRIAGERFAQRGYAGTTVRDIAEAAGLTSGSLYHHFESKEAMLDEILRGFLGELVASFERIHAEARDARDGLAQLVRRTFRVIHEMPYAVVIFQSEARVLAGRSGFEYVARTTGRVEAIWREIVAEGQRAGIFRGDVDIGITYRFVRDTVWASVRWYRPEGSFGPDDLADQFLRVLLGGLLTDSKS